jgi:hypothetical protein
MTSADEIVRLLAGLRFPNCFNPYSDRCLTFDQEAAPQRRVQLLKEILERASQVEIDSIWVGRDLGHRGGRRTGLALTDDLLVRTHARRWAIEAERFTSGEPVVERTAAIAWRVLEKIAVPVFLWNVFPLHPHEPEDEFTNRRHNASERDAGEAVLLEIIRLLRPQKLVGLGADAFTTASRLTNGQQVSRVRHPSYGGQIQFEEQISSMYEMIDYGRLTGLDGYANR